MNSKRVRNGYVLFFLLLAGFVIFPFMAGAETVVAKKLQPLTGQHQVFLVIAAIISVLGSCIASAFALSKIGTTALGAMSEKPEIGGRALVFLGMAEGIAIYGLIVAILILNKL